MPTMNRIDMEDVTLDKSGQEVSRRKLNDEEIRKRLDAAMAPKRPMKDFGAEGLGDLTGPPELTKPVKKAKGGSVSSASKRADGCCVKGKTRGKIV